MTTTRTNPQLRYQAGDKIGGRYFVYKALVGGMGEVYLCLDVEAEMPFALKTFRGSASTNQRLVEAFEAEVSAWIALEKHHNIVRCHTMEFIDRQPFMILEWIEGDPNKGSDLRSWLTNGALEPQLALDFIIDVTRGLVYATKKQPGIVHRDLKPENILIAQDTTAKITDFGLAKIVQTGGVADTLLDSEPGTRYHTTNKAGTPLYMAPEQWTGEELDSRTDLYAVGCMLYELLTGHFAYFAARLTELGQQHLTAPIPVLPPNHYMAGLNPVLQLCLAKNRNQRYSSPIELLNDLADFYQMRFARSPKEEPLTSGYNFADYNNRAIAYERLGRSHQALEDLNQCIELNPSFAVAYNNRGTSLDSLERYHEALADYARAIELDPNNKLAYYNRALSRFRLGDIDLALQDCSHAIACDPEYAIAYLNRANLYFELNLTSEALADYEVAIRLQPDYLLAYLNRSELYSFLECFEAAVADLTQAIRLNDSDPSIYYRRANLFRQMSRYEEALSDYAQTLSLDPTHSKALVNRGNIQSNKGNYSAALADYSVAIELTPDDDKAYYNRGNAFRSLRRYNEALADYDRTIELNSGHPWAHLDRGAINVMLERYESALSDFALSIEKNPSNPDAYLYSGRLLIDLGSSHQAISYLEKAAQLGDREAEQMVAELKRGLN
ncbi:MAG TPA: tetratricopeptide repeat protein [Pyrinomonadaceae bacterium]|nr:tetratricopeptide repeat protein [Pyrinomonadaceae bacterium]